ILVPKVSRGVAFCRLALCFRPRNDLSPRQSVAEELEPEQPWGCVGSDLQRVDVHRVHRDEVAMLPVAGRRSRTDVLGEAAVSAQLDRAVGQAGPLLVAG